MYLARRWTLGTVGAHRGHGRATLVIAAMYLIAHIYLYSIVKHFASHVYSTGSRLKLLGTLSLLMFIPILAKIFRTEYQSKI